MYNKTQMRDVDGIGYFDCAWMRLANNNFFYKSKSLLT